MTHIDTHLSPVAGHAVVPFMVYLSIPMLVSRKGAIFHKQCFTSGDGLWRLVFFSVGGGLLVSFPLVGRLDWWFGGYSVVRGFPFTLHKNQGLLDSGPIFAPAMLKLPSCQGCHWVDVDAIPELDSTLLTYRQREQSLHCPTRLTFAWWFPAIPLFLLAF